MKSGRSSRIEQRAADERKRFAEAERSALGAVDYQREQCRRRAARNERTRERTREVVAAKRANEQLTLLSSWGEAS